MSGSLLLGALLVAVAERLVDAAAVASFATPVTDLADSEMVFVLFVGPFSLESFLDVADFVHSSVAV